MSRNMAAGRALLTEEERQAVDALLDGTPGGELAAFKLQLRLVREKRKAEKKSKEPA